MAYEKQTWENGEVITAEKMNHIESGVESAQNIYSLDESVIGRWVDGRPIYRNTYPFTTSVVGANTVTNIQNVNFVIRLYGINILDTGDKIPVPTSYISPYCIAVSFKLDGTLSVIPGHKDYLGAGYITIEYTKATDEATIEIPETFTQPVESQSTDKLPDFEGMSKPELLNYVKENGVEGVSSAMTKAKIIDAIKNA